jgi:pimeloyl-ACP methyl ester carboxylesterase
MPHVERNGASLYYEQHGEGPPVLLSHGFSAASPMWAEQIPALSQAFRLITWDMRGHGQTTAPDDANKYSEAETIADMAAVLDACGADTAVIGGLSLGGYMSLAFYRQHPERTRALMLFDTGPGFRNPDARTQWNQRAEEWATTIETLGLGALARLGTDEMQRDWHTNAQALAHAARGMLAQFNADVLESLPNIHVPTLILVGENDEPFLAPAEYMAKKIPNAKKIVIPDAGHAANMHNPNAFNSAVLAFLNGLGNT